MTTTLKFGGDPEKLIGLLFGFMGSLPSPFTPISDLVQNGIDAGANNIEIKIVRNTTQRPHKTEKIIISDDGHGFLESFERYSSNTADSIKKKCTQYMERREKGESRGEFCIGMQGFRSIASELHIINLTKKDMTPQDKEGSAIKDEAFSKMFKHRRLKMFKEREGCDIDEEGDLETIRTNHGVTYILSGLTITAEKALTVRNIVSFLSVQKRTELLKIKNLKVEVTDGSKKEIVKSNMYEGKKVLHKIQLPNQDKDTSKRGFGEVTAELFYHPPKEGSKIAITVKGEPVYLDLCQKIEGFAHHPWNVNMVEGTIEYERLTKQPGRVELARDRFYDAFLEMLSVLEKEVEVEVKEIEKAHQSKRDDKLLDKLEDVFGKIRREIDLNILGSTASKKILKGPLASIQAFPEKDNIEAFERKTLYVRASDSEDNELTQDDGIEFSWKVTGSLGTITPTPNGNEALFEAGSTVGTTTVLCTAKDKTALHELQCNIEIVIMHPTKPGPLYRAKIVPGMAIVPINKHREFRAVAEDSNGNITRKGIRSSWKIVHDTSDGAKINKDYGETIIFTAGRRIGQVKLHLRVQQGNSSKEDFAIIDVKEPKEKEKIPPKKMGLPVLEPYYDETEFPKLKHSELKYDKDSKPIALRYNEAHRDYKEVKDDKNKREWYIATLYAKELVLLDCKELGIENYGERLIEVLSRLDIHLR